MPKKIITSNLNEEFNNAKQGKNANQKTGAKIIKNPTGVTMGKSAILEKTDLPKNVQRKMAAGIGFNGMNLMNNTKMLGSSFYHPLFQSYNMLLPRDRRERNEWTRHFYRTNEIVASAIDFHTEAPISNFSLQCPDEDIKEFFEYMLFDKLNINELLLNIGLEYWKIGDVFPFGQLDEVEGIWDSFTMLNPDYINIVSNSLANEQQIELVPDEQIKTIVEAGPSGQYKDLYAQLPSDIIRSIKSGRNIKLDNRLVTHIAHKASPYETWGTPLMMRCFKTLIYEDKLRQAQDAIATRHIFPIRVAKIGAPGEPMPTQEDLDSFRDVLLEADQDPNYFIVYHYGLQFDYVGSAGKILPLQQEFDFTTKKLLSGMCISEALLNGEGYDGARVGMEALMKKYMSYRLRLENWVRYKVLKPIAEIQGFYRPVKSEINGGYRIANRKDRQLVIPEIRWDVQDLTSNQAIMSTLQQMQNKGLVSVSTMLPILGLDPDTEKANLERERGTVFDPNAPKTGPLPGNSGNPASSAPQNGSPGGSTSPSIGNRPGNQPSSLSGGQMPTSPPSAGESSSQASIRDNRFFVTNELKDQQKPHKLMKISLKK